MAVSVTGTALTGKVTVMVVGAGRKFAVTLTLEIKLRPHVPPLGLTELLAALQAPLQPINVEGAVAVAVSVTLGPLDGYVLEQFPDCMPLASEQTRLPPSDTLPVPVPSSFTVTEKLETLELNVAVTGWLLSPVCSRHTVGLPPTGH